MTDLSPDSVISLAKSFLKDEEKAKKYIWNQEDRRFSPNLEKCDEKCRRNLYCEVSNTDYFATQYCKGY